MLTKKGPKLVTFSPILKYNRLPLTNVIKDLLRLGKQSFGADVEIEFAVNIPKDDSKPKEFYFLQIRPMVVGREAVQVRIDDLREPLCCSHRTIGNGLYQNIRDIIFVNPQTFELKDSSQIAREIGELKNFVDQGRAPLHPDWLRPGGYRRPVAGDTFGMVTNVPGAYYCGS